MERKVGAFYSMKDKGSFARQVFLLYCNDNNNNNINTNNPKTYIKSLVIFTQIGLPIQCFCCTLQILYSYVIIKAANYCKNM